MYLHSISAYADKIFDELDSSSLQALKTMPATDLPRLHLTWGTAIRNEFGLWNDDHPLTKKWYLYPDQRDIRDGVDYSPDHPDSVSMEIMKKVWSKAHA